MRLSIILLFAVMSAVASRPLGAQGLASPSPPVALPSPVAIGTGPALARPQPIVPRVAGQLQQPGKRANGIPATGPAAGASIRPAVPRTAPLDAKPRQVVLDEAGRPVPGTVRVAPDRALDPATGRTYRVIPPPAAGRP